MNGKPPAGERALRQTSAFTCPLCKAEFRSRDKNAKYCSQSCRSKANAKPPTTGMRRVMAVGYIRVTLPGGQREYEHRLVWEAANGPIPAGALIHHANGDKTDNRLENLVLVESVAAHNAEHGGTLRHYYSRKAATCHPERRHRALGLCLSCYSKHRRALS